jgi:PAS domain S-box-containing protein
MSGVQYIDNLDDFFHLLPVALYRTTPAGKLLAANQALAELLGFESTEELLLRGRDVESYYVEGSIRDGWIDEIENHGRVEELDFELTRSDGSTIWVRDTARVARDGQGEVLYFEGALVDVSEKIRLRHSQEEFIATVSHELRNPISVALGLSQEMADDYDSFGEDERRKMVEMIARESEEAAWLIEDLLVAYHDDRRALSFVPSSFPVNREIERIVSNIEPPVAFAAHEDLTVAADPGRTRQIIRNLVSNAVRYGGSRISVEIEAEDTRAVVRVCDDGDRIEDVVVETIFEPFGQERRKIIPNSIGLGLPVSRKLARLMGGDVQYSYEDNRSCFSLFLPLG